MTTMLPPRGRIRARLASTSTRLQGLQVRLEALHADRSGAAQLYYSAPLIPDEWLPISRSLGAIERYARAGCAASAEWLAATADQRALIARLRETRLTPRAADHAGPWLMPATAKFVGKPQRCTYAAPGNASPTAQPDNTEELP